ncbi:MAG: hypothetical protein AAGK02_09265, partial [Pseudomonadota bacterium]
GHGRCREAVWQALSQDIEVEWFLTRQPTLYLAPATHLLTDFQRISWPSRTSEYPIERPANPGSGELSNRPMFDSG